LVLKKTGSHPATDNGVQCREKRGARLRPVRLGALAYTSPQIRE
jgi:hypothetical protein